MALRTRFLAALAAAFLLLSCVSARAESPADYDISAPENLSESHLYAQSALLVDADTGEVLFSKNSRVRMYPASTTKIMTLLLGLENGPALDAQVTIPAEAADIAQGSSVVPVLPGDVMTFRDLLYGFMLSSGNDGANAVAVLVDGTIEAFVARMNARAEALGMEGTHYANAHGYHDSQHYTTAQDLAVLSREAMQNAEFRQIVATARYTISVERSGETVTSEIISRNSLLQSDLKYYYPDCTGIKTGHHSKAGWCFVGSAERDGKRVICVVLNCAQENDKWYDAARLFEYGFTRFENSTVETLLRQGFDRFSSVRIGGADPGADSLALNLGPVEGGETTVPLVRGSDLSRKSAVERVCQGVTIEWQRPLEAPVAEGEVMGLLTCRMGDGSVATARLTAAQAVAAAPTEPPASPEAVVTQPPAASGIGTTPDPPVAPDNRWVVPVFASLVALLLVCLVALALLRRSHRRRRRRRRRSGVRRR